MWQIAYENQKMHKLWHRLCYTFCNWNPCDTGWNLLGGNHCGVEYCRSNDAVAGAVENKQKSLNGLLLICLLWKKQEIPIALNGDGDFT